MTADPAFFGVYNNPDWTNNIGVQTPEMTPPAPWKALSGGKDTVNNWSGNIKFGKERASVSGQHLKDECQQGSEEPRRDHREEQTEA